MSKETEMNLKIWFCQFHQNYFLREKSVICCIGLQYKMVPTFDCCCMKGYLVVNLASENRLHSSTFTVSSSIVWPIPLPHKFNNYVVRTFAGKCPFLTLWSRVAFPNLHVWIQHKILSWEISSKILKEEIQHLIIRFCQFQQNFYCFLENEHIFTTELLHLKLSWSIWCHMKWNFIVHPTT